MEAFYQNKNLRLKKVFFNTNEIRLIKAGLTQIYFDNRLPNGDHLTVQDEKDLINLKRLLREST